MSARLHFNEYTALASQHSVRQQLRDGETPTATIGVFVPHGKSDRLVQVPLSRDDCLHLAEVALAAVRILDTAEVVS